MTPDIGLFLFRFRNYQNVANLLRAPEVVSLQARFLL
jgi:hypothetical protein